MPISKKNLVGKVKVWIQVKDGRVPLPLPPLFGAKPMVQNQFNGISFAVAADPHVNSFIQNKNAFQ